MIWMMILIMGPILGDGPALAIPDRGGETDPGDLRTAPLNLTVREQRGLCVCWMYTRPNLAEVPTVFR